MQGPLMAISGGIKRWLVAASIVTGIIAGIVSGLNPGDTPIAMNQAWTYHQIVVGASGTGQPDGADGVSIGDVDGDGLMDVATGHEQGLRMTLSFNPGPADVESPWPTLTLPSGSNLCSAEDATIADVDGDGAKDVVVACETGTVRVSIFFAPAPPNTRGELLNAANWNQVDIALSAGNRSMRVLVANIDADAGNEIIVGGKESSGPCVAAAVAYYKAALPGTQASWSAATYNVIEPAGWVMNMYVQDLDGDADLDIVYTDREPIDCPTPGGANQGIVVLKSTGVATPPVYASAVRYDGGEGDHKWFYLYDWDGDTDLDILDCRSTTGVNESQILLNGGSFNSFATVIPLGMPSGSGQCQQIIAADLDDDNLADLVYSNAQSQALHGVSWFRVTGSAGSPTKTNGTISGILDSDSDVKFDNIDCTIDIDGDGDLDCFDTEQHMTGGTGPGLGVVYFENPLLTFTAPTQVGCTLLTAGTNTTDAALFDTAVVSPNANRAIYAIVQSAAGAGPNVPATTGNGITYTQERSVTFGTRRLTVFRGMSASPTSTAIRFDWTAQTQTSAVWQVVECSNVDTGGTNASAATAQSASATVAAGTTFTATLPGALAGSTSRLMCVVGIDIASSVTPDADLLEYDDRSVAAGASTLEGQSALNQTACTPTFSSANGGGIAWEVKAP